MVFCLLFVDEAVNVQLLVSSCHCQFFYSFPNPSLIFEFIKIAKGESPLTKIRYCNMTSYLHDHNYCLESLETILLNRMNKVKLSDIPKLEKKTRKNRRLWHRLRRTRVTASIAHDIIRTLRSKRLLTPISTSFLNNHFRDKPVLTKAMQWGITNEDTALKAYSDLFGDNYSKIGLVIDQHRHYISATPDAISDSRETLVEIKCPYSVRHTSPESVEYLKSGRLKTNHRYFTQMQIQMHVCQIHKCDFVVWTPKGIYVQGIEYDADLVAGFLIDLEFYYKNVFAPRYFETINSGN